MAMTIGERALSRSYTPSLSLTSVGTVIVQLLGNLQRRHDLRRSRRMLGQLDDRLLRDIGVDRATAKHEATRSFWD
jgi:uncharacterized protein YjiS (DUF1127 family)